MNCKGCGKEITGNEYKKVADWTFCLDCFEKLMNPSEREMGTGEEFHSEPYEKDEPDKKKQSYICKICEADIEKGKEKKLGIWTLCESCYNDMTFRPQGKKIQKKDDVEDDVEDAISEITDMEKMNTGKTILCSGCNRIILEIAAKKDGDDSLCPDCFYKRRKK